jgi:hypothetical protein
VILPAAVNPGLDRPTNTLLAAYAPVDRPTLDRVTDAVLADLDDPDHPAPRPAVLLAVSDNGFIPVRDGLALALTERGMPVRNPGSLVWFVDDERLVDWSTVRTGLVLVVDEGVTDDATTRHPVPGAVIADVDSRDGFDRRAYEALVAAAQAGGPVRLGSTAEQAIAALPTASERALTTELLTQIPDEARELMGNPDVLRFLRDHPLASPRLDPGLIGRVLDSLPAASASEARLRVFRLDRTELLAFEHRTQRGSRRPAHPGNATPPA